MLIFNTLTRKKEYFIPSSSTVSIYVCGITPYDTTHLGHAFTYIFFDTLIRFLRYKRIKVIYAQNITDIDNDLLKRSHESNQNWQQLGDYWTKHFTQDMERLNISPPDYYVKATSAIEKIIEMNLILEKKGFAYFSNGNLYFKISSFNKYGQLSQFTKPQMMSIAQERGGITEDPNKKDPLDFILWQKSNAGEPSWESPWGLGRSGWHIECSAMINKYLGQCIEIHGGGRDLVFPHHESEIAQTESVTGNSPFVKYWMHTSMVMYQGEKMSKSLGNLIMVSDLLKKHSYKSIRLMLLSHYYRLPWEYNESELVDMDNLIRLTDELIILSEKNNHLRTSVITHPVFQKFISFLEDDFNFPQAISVMQDLIKEIQNSKSDQLIHILCEMLMILGLKDNINQKWPR